MGFAVAILLLASTAAPQSVTGKWEGKITSQRDDGSMSEDSALLILEQKDTTVTGSVGGGESDQHPITDGKADGNKISLIAKHATNGREYRLELTIENDELKGTVTSGPRRAQLYAKKRKE